MPSVSRAASTAVWLALAVALAAGGCAEPPRSELQAAQTALESAKSAAADTYAPDSFSKAQESMVQARAELATQEGKFRLLRSYDRARQLAQKVKADADRAGQEAAVAKLQAQQDARAAIESARGALAEANAALANAPAGKDSKTDTEAMKAELTALKGLLAEAESADTGEDYARARQRATQVRDQAAAIQGDIATAIQKAHAKRK
jgi:hypothetical protein